jgi:OOP family OmpA-OmpF porin
MNKYRSNQPGKENTGNAGDNEWGQVRSLLVGPEKKRLEMLEKRFTDPDKLAREIGNVLPDAVSHTPDESEKLARAFSPVVEKAVHESVKKNTRTFANVLYPVIRPAIQKAIAETFKKMLQSFNKAIENSFTIRGIRWRFQSLVTGKSFAEVVLLHSLVYSVDQVFLIHKESGLLLHQVHSSLDISRDGDLVSAMLKAIQDFVNDSFRVDREKEGLETIQVGDFSIWIEQGEFVILAGVIRGSAPENVRTLLKTTLQQLEHEYRDELNAFDGDTSPFEKTGGLVETCLKDEVKKTKRKTPLISWLLPVAFFAAIGYLIFSPAVGARKWSSYLADVDRIPGVIVTETGKRDGKFFIKGLRDPMSVNPSTLLDKHQLEAGEVVSRWDFYHSLEPRYILARARRILNPPAAVKLGFKEGVLSVSGKAPHRWVQEVDIAARGIPGIRRVDKHKLVDGDAEEFQAIINNIEDRRYEFDVGSPQLPPDRESDMDAFVNQVQRLQALSQILGRAVTVFIHGSADASGSVDINRELSLQRAEHIRQVLLARGIPGYLVMPVGLDAPPPAAGENETADTARKRSVTFKVQVSPPPYEGR